MHLNVNNTIAWCNAKSDLYTVAQRSIFWTKLKQFFMLYTFIFHSKNEPSFLHHAWTQHCRAEDPCGWLIKPASFNYFFSNIVITNIWQMPLHFILIFVLYLIAIYYKLECLTFIELIEPYLWSCTISGSIYFSSQHWGIKVTLKFERDYLKEHNEAHQGTEG